MIALLVMLAVPPPPPVVPPVRVVGADGGATLSVSGAFYPATQPVSGTLTCNAGTGTLAVSGAFYQATQPVSLAAAPTTPVTGTFWQATQPISGTVTANAGTGTLAVSLASVPTHGVTGTFWQATQPVSGTFWQATQPVSGTFWQATQPVSGTVAATQSGAWALSANQSVNVAQVNGVAPLMGSGATGTGSPRVTLATDSPGLSTANGAIPAQSALQSGRAVAYGSSPAAVTAGNNAPAISDLEGIPYVNMGHPRSVFCQMASGSGTTLAELTGCAAVASNSYYVKSIVMTGGIANAATVPALIRSGTGANCGTATATWATCWHGTAGSCVYYFDPPIKITASHALCHIDATAGTKSVMLTGYIAP